MEWRLFFIVTGILIIVIGNWAFIEFINNSKIRFSKINRLKTKIKSLEGEIKIVHKEYWGLQAKNVDLEREHKYYKTKYDNIMKRQYGRTEDEILDEILFGFSSELDDEKPCDIVAENKSEKVKLEEKLAEINFNEKYPLCADIKKVDNNFIDFFVKGKLLDTFTKRGAIDYAKKHLKQTDWTKIENSAYEVVKKPSKK